MVAFHCAMAIIVTMMGLGVYWEFQDHALVWLVLFLLFLAVASSLGSAALEDLKRTRQGRLRRRHVM